MRLSFLACGLVGYTVLARATVPLTSAEGGHLLVPVTVDGAGPVLAVLDTGADASGVYEWFAHQQRLRSTGNNDVEGMTGSRMMPTFRLGRITIDGRTVANVMADGYPNRQDNEPQALVVGNDFMDGSIAVFDFPCHSVQIRSKPLDMARMLTRHAIQLSGGSVKDGTQLTIPIRIGKVQGTAVLDTGSRRSKLNLSFARAAGLDPASGVFMPGEVIYGANMKAASPRFGPIGTVEYANVVIPAARAEIIDLPVFQSFGLSGPAMILGVDLLRGVRLVYDHEAKSIWFDRSHCSHAK